MKIMVDALKKSVAGEVLYFVGVSVDFGEPFILGPFLSEGAMYGTLAMIEDLLGDLSLDVGSVMNPGKKRC